MGSLGSKPNQEPREDGGQIPSRLCHCNKATVAVSTTTGCLLLSLLVWLTKDSYPPRWVLSTALLLPQKYLPPSLSLHYSCTAASDSLNLDHRLIPLVDTTGELSLLVSIVGGGPVSHIFWIPSDEKSVWMLKGPTPLPSPQKRSTIVFKLQGFETNIAKRELKPKVGEVIY